MFHSLTSVRFRLGYSVGKTSLSEQVNKITKNKKNNIYMCVYIYIYTHMYIYIYIYIYVSFVIRTHDPSVLVVETVLSAFWGYM